MRVSSVLCEVCFNTSQGFLVGYLIIGWLVSDIAPGAKQWDVQLENLGSFLYYIHAGTVIYGISISLIKLPILLQWLCGARSYTESAYL
ncbi:hypothetical protein HO173_013321 [Letharia columbiana]|uniref:Uncharacterized protein n=1 Tax=Letharia columbiana TaxID=112416 RepID=A0A8H6CGI6_9LECA|nr:uncharacterized protein HO173_013321 [Letharia columbiana]KAF6223108.1 hypothetical protein HO173_013321 [Letharia columbiana]